MLQVLSVLLSVCLPCGFLTRKKRSGKTATQLMALVCQLCLYCYVLTVMTFRWRNSFLFSLIFGIPVMIVMIFNMVRAAAVTCPADGRSDVVTATTSGSGLITAAESSTDEKCTSHSMMLLPGLSLTNLLLFLMCTPCQVRTFTCEHFYWLTFFPLIITVVIRRFNVA